MFAKVFYEKHGLPLNYLSDTLHLGIRAFHWNTIYINKKISITLPTKNLLLKGLGLNFGCKFNHIFVLYWLASLFCLFPSTSEVNCHLLGFLSVILFFLATTGERGSLVCFLAFDFPCSFSFF